MIKNWIVDNIQLENKLKELSERKAAEEGELYDNFVLVLNEKKKRIQHLHEQLEAFKKGRPTINQEVCNKGRKIKKEKNVMVKKEEVSDSDICSSNDEKDYSTDKEEYTANQLTEYEPVPSTSKASMLLNDPPPRHLLPKRVKRKHSEDKEINDSIAINTLKAVQKNEVSTSKLDDSPDISFNTQDLLDHI